MVAVVCLVLNEFVKYFDKVCIGAHLVSFSHCPVTIEIDRYLFDGNTLIASADNVGMDFRLNVIQKPDLVSFEDLGQAIERYCCWKVMTYSLI